MVSSNYYIFELGVAYFTCNNAKSVVNESGNEMKYAAYISALASFMLLSCNNISTDKIATTDSIRVSRILHNDAVDFNKLAKYYKDTTFSDLIVHPDTANHSGSHYYLEGKQIDSATVSRLPEFITNRLAWTEGFYGVYSFEMDHQLTGLITRTPGAYYPSVISLWVYDHKRKEITNKVELADRFGDAGAAEMITSYLFFEKPNSLSVFLYRHYSYDHSVEDETDHTVEESHSFTLQRIKTNLIDTLSTDSTQLSHRFKKQLAKLMTYGW